MMFIKVIVVPHLGSIINRIFIMTKLYVYKSPCRDSSTKFQTIENYILCGVVNKLLQDDKSAKGRQFKEKVFGKTTLF